MQFLVKKKNALSHCNIGPFCKHNCFFFFRIGIIGEQLSLFNPVTLTPVGADNEEEENEDAEKNSTSRKE